ncbi:MAG: lactate utilization protein [Paludibacter sp.]|nr:lactate utilization protein [Paludibacter sp.]
MQSNSSREEILQRIAAAQSGRLAFVNSHAESANDIYKAISPNAVTCFRSELEAISGQCILCENEADLYRKLKEFVEQKEIPTIFCQDSYISGQLNQYNINTTGEKKDFELMSAGITGCEFLIARTGSVLVSSASESGRQMSVFPPIHIVLAHVSQLVGYPEDALVAVQDKYGDTLPSTISTITGPSRTADIEKTLVLGAHGPKELVVFLSKA